MTGEKEPKRVKASRGRAPRPVLTRVQAADQALDALEIVGTLLLRARFGGHGNRAGRKRRRATVHLRGRIQSAGHGARGDALPLQQLRSEADHGGRHRGGEQGVVRQVHGQGVRVVPEPWPHRVQEGVSMHRGGGGGRGGGRRGRGRRHVGVGVGEEASEGRHGDALKQGEETALSKGYTGENM